MTRAYRDEHLQRRALTATSRLQRGRAYSVVVLTATSAYSNVALTATRRKLLGRLER